MRHALWVLVAFGAGGCAEKLLEAPTADRLVLSVSELHLAPGERGRLTFTLRAEDGTLIVPYGINWDSRDTAVVTVDSVGRLTARGEGTTYVIARSAGVGDSASVVVRRDWLFSAGGNRCRVRGDGAVLCAGLQLTAPAGTFAAAMWYTSMVQCVIATGGVVHCRGDNQHGGLGDGSDTSTVRNVFAPVDGPGGYQQVTLGSFSAPCARRGAEIRCWGYDNYGAVGNDTARVDVGIPTVVAGGLTFTSLVEEGHDQENCGTAAGRLWCWGGYGSDVSLRVPRAVSPDHGFVRASRGSWHTCALDNEGQALCWGYNNDGELGRGTVGPAWVFDSTPAPVVTDLRFVDIVVSFYFTCAVSTDGELWCWGSGKQGQLGAPATTRAPTPTKVPSEESFVSIHRGTGLYGACALTIGGAEYCWGDLSPNLDTKPEDYLPRRTPPPY